MHIQIVCRKLKNRLEKEAEEKRMIPEETQADFRRGRSMIDNIFVHIIQREENKKGEEKVFIKFI